MNHKDIFITGLGVISAAGNSLPETLKTFREEKRNAGRVTLFNTALQYPVFEVIGLPAEYCQEGQRTLSLALCAVNEAIEHAKLGKNLSGIRVGICMGTTVASQLNDIKFYKNYRDSGSSPMKPVDRYLKGNIAEFISKTLKVRGPTLTVVNACSSGSDAIGVALSWVKSDLCDLVVAGGADEMSLIPLSGFGSLGVVSQELCMPFDKKRKGLNLGEGAGVLIIESKESAKKRGVTSNLRLLGYGSASDAYHLTAPRPDGAGLDAAINKALSDAEIKPQDVAFVNAHGTATIDNDLVEGKVLGQVFGNQLKLFSTKGFTGHTLGAAGGMEAVFSASSLKEGWIPANVGFKHRDENISVVPVKQQTSFEGQYAVSTSLAFGGNNAALVLGLE